MDNPQPNQTRFQLYMASIKRHHYLPFITPVQLISLLFFGGMIYMSFVVNNAQPDFVNTVTHTFVLLLLIIAMIANLLFYPLAIQAVVNHPVLYQLAIPRKLAESRRLAQEAYDNTEKHWRVTYYGWQEIGRTFDDENAKFKAQMVMNDHVVGILVRGAFRVILCTQSYYIGTLVFFLCRKRNLEF